MTSTEIWLRLIQVGDLSGDKWLSIAQQLERSGAMTAADLQVLGLTVAQTRRFFFPFGTGTRSLSVMAG